MFRLEWLETALNQLAEIWMTADSETRRAITAASHQIDEHLQSDPFQESEQRSGGRRVYFVSPLGVLFRVDDESVSILRVWIYQS